MDSLLNMEVGKAIKIEREVNVREYRSHQKSKDEVITELAWVVSNKSVCED